MPGGSSLVPVIEDGLRRGKRVFIKSAIVPEWQQITDYTPLGGGVAKTPYGPGQEDFFLIDDLIGVRVDT